MKVNEEGIFLIDADELIKDIRSFIKDDRVFVTMKSSHCVIMHSKIPNLASQCYDVIEWDLKVLYGVDCNESSICVDREGDLHTVELDLSMCDFIVKGGKVYGRGVKKGSCYSVSGKITKERIADCVSEALVGVLQDTELACSKKDMLSSIHLHKAYISKDYPNKGVFPVGIVCSSLDVAESFVDELDCVAYEDFNDSLVDALSNNIGYLGVDTDDGIEVILYLIIETV